MTGESSAQQGSGQYVDIDPIAAEEYNGNKECRYDGCENEADWLVEVSASISGPGVLTIMCQSCSNSNRVYVTENEVIQHEISEEARDKSEYKNPSSEDQQQVLDDD